MAGGRDYDAERLKELVLHIADRSLTDPRFGKTKLNKILFFSDFTAYLLFGRSITGATYQHLPQGPCPHQMLPVLAALQEENAVLIKEEQIYGGVIQHRIMGLREPSLMSFKPDEIGMVDHVINVLAPLTNTEVSEFSHDTCTWRITAEYQEIPYGAAVFSSDAPTDEDMEWLRGVASSRAAVAET